MKILGIESSCDETAAAIVEEQVLRSNIIATQEIHSTYGGVVPELASRAHQQNIVPVVELALQKAGITKNELDAIAFTRGPGLMGSLLVGISFAKGLALALNIPLIEVNHLQGHILSHFIITPGTPHLPPSFPFLCLTVSGGHTQIVTVNDYLDYKVIGQTLDDAAGEAFDKAAKIMGLPYPGGPVLDKLAERGNPERFKYPMPKMEGLNFSFSGLKTSFLYHINRETTKNPSFVKNNLEDLCASYRATIITILMDKLIAASQSTGIKQIALAGGVSANAGLRKALTDYAATHEWRIFIPKIEYCTDNAAMIAISGYYKYLKQDFTTMGAVPMARYPI
jgi:N6-L-threonylcarbamoyladenine synthase